MPRRVTRAATANILPSFLYILLLLLLLLPLSVVYFVNLPVCVCALRVLRRVGKAFKSFSLCARMPINTHTPCGTVIYLRAVQAFAAHTRYAAI